MATDFSKYSHQQLQDLVNYLNSGGGIDSIASNATNAAQQLELMVTSYMNQVSGVGQSWTGKAADSYMQFASNLGTAAQALTDQLNSVGGTLTSVSSSIAQAKSDMPPVPTDAINQLNQWQQTPAVSASTAGRVGGYTQSDITNGISANQATINQAHAKAVSAMNNLASMYPIYTQELQSSNTSVQTAIAKVRSNSSTSTGTTSSSSDGSGSSSGQYGVSSGSGSSGSGPRSYGVSSPGSSSSSGYKVAAVNGGSTSGSGSGGSGSSSGTSGGGYGVTPPSVGTGAGVGGSSGTTLAGVGSGGLGGLGAAAGAGGGAGSAAGGGGSYGVTGAAGLGGLGRLSEAVGGGDYGTTSSGPRTGSPRSGTSGSGASGEDSALGSAADSGASGGASGEGGMLGGMGGMGGTGGDQNRPGQRAKFLTQDPDWWYGDALKNSLPAGGLIEE